MAVTTAPRQSAEPRSFHPRWPARGVDASRIWIDYCAAADELMVYFAEPVPAVSVPIETPDRDYVYLRVDEASESVVGIQVETFRTWVTDLYPCWAPLADPAATADARREAATALIADVAGLFARYGAGGV